MDEGKTIKLKSKDGQVFDLLSKAASKSGLLKGILVDYPEDSEIPLNKINGATLKKVIEYLNHYKDNEPTAIQKPLKDKDFSKCVPSWDYDFLGDDNNEILDIIRAANFLDIKPLIELASAKIASKIRGTTTESIRKEFGIENFSKEEEEQINKDKDYLERNL